MALPEGIQHYQAWFHDPRNRKNYPMELDLVFARAGIGGTGKDEFGSFAILNGKLDSKSNSIEFTKAYPTHEVEYSGNITRWNTPFRTEGTWKLADIHGTWGMTQLGTQACG